MNCPLCKIPVQDEFNSHLYNDCELVNKIILPKHPMMQHITSRRMSFIGWPQQKLSGQSLAEVGFFFTRKKDTLKCYWCDVTVKDWQTFDNALETHLNREPGCMYLWNHYFSQHNQTMILVCKDCNLFTVDVSHSIRCTFLLRKDIETRNDPGRFPRNPTMKLESRRLQTFDEWPLKEPSITKLVNSGFYYTGMGDAVRCFHCDEVFSNWLKYDSPLEKHLEKCLNCSVAKMAKQLKTKLSKINYNAMRFEINRLHTFNTWHKRSSFNVKHLAKIGFFNLEHEDYVQCAFCRVLVGNWDSEDVQDGDSEYLPVRKHLIKNPECPFLKGLNNSNKPIKAKLIEPCNMMSEMNRLTTLQDLKNTNISKFDLAEAGFYFKYGIVLCFWCHFELKSFEKTSLEMHAKSRPDCLFAQSSFNYKNRFEKSEECKVCMTAEIEIVFSPCNHFVSCSSCANRLENCCVCRREISQRMKVYKC